MLHRWTHERFGEGPDSSISELVDGQDEHIIYVVEDQYQQKKVPKQTRIPVGLYELDVRPDSPKFAHYYDRWDWFRGMPWIRDVEGDGEGFELMQFSWVYYHPGADDEDSWGCPITGLRYEETIRGDFRIVPGTSRPAFEKLCKLVYPIVLDTPEDRLFVRVTDHRVGR